MRNKLKKITCLVLAVICMAGISVTAYASGGGEETAVPNAEEILETGTDTGACPRRYYRTDQTNTE